MADYFCVVCRGAISGDFEDVGLQLEVHLYDGWPVRMPGHEELGQRPILQAHEGDCTTKVLEHLARVEREGLP